MTAGCSSHRPISCSRRTSAFDPAPLHTAIIEALGGGGAFLFRQLTDSLDEDDDRAIADALWDLVWSGRVSNDTFAPMRTLVGRGGAHRTTRPAPRGRIHGRRVQPRVALQGPPTVSGRWFALPDAPTDSTALQLARTESLLGRYGVVTRGSVMAEGTPGGFAGVYRVLRELEQTGACLRGYYIDTLGAAQFAAPSTVDRMRTHVIDDDAVTDAEALTLAATDPANPFGAALPWPARTTDSKHRPARKAGSLVVMHDGRLVLYLERGSKKVLVFDDDPARLAAAAASLAATVRARRVHRLSVETVDGDPSRTPRWARHSATPVSSAPPRDCSSDSMPEGDTAWRTARLLHETLAGHELTVSDFRVPEFATLDLTGQRVDEAVSRGKHLLIRVGRHSIHTHLKMEGAWHVYRLDERWRRPAHTARVVLATSERQAVGFSLGITEVLDRQAEA